jgi:hypothetical protein
MEAAMESESELAQLRAEVEYLALVTQALWELLKKDTGASDELLMTTIREVDLKDGRLDGRSVRLPEKCSECGKAVSGLTHKCAHCGARLERDKPF